MNKSESVNELAAALAKAQAKMQNPHFDSKNPFFKSQYASLAAVRNAMVPVLAEFGLSVMQEIRFADGMSHCATTLLHSSGQWIEQAPFSVPIAKADAQGACAGATYARRASLQALGCVVGDTDGDGEEAVGRGGDASQGNVAAPAKGYSPKYKKTGAPDPIGPAGDPAAVFDGAPAANAEPAGAPSIATGFLNNLEAASTEGQIDSIVKGIVLIAGKISEADKAKLREAASAARLRVKAKPYVPPTAAQLMSELLGLKSQLGDAMFEVLVRKHMGEPEASNFSLGTDGLRNLRDECIRATNGAKV